MSYDIPPPLQHKEKIIFGLTFSQLAYALPSALLIFAFVFKTSLSFVVSGPVSLIIACTASFFMFFDGMNKIKHGWNYLRNPKVKVMDKILKQIVDIQKIENKIVYQSKAKLAILEVIPMNFILKTEEEKESILVSFQKFLNSLDFPIQIHITSNPIHLTEHFTHTQKRNFYIIIKEKDDLEMQVKVCAERLQIVGVRVKRLNDEQLTDLFYSYIAGKKQKESQQEEIKDVAHFLFAPEKVVFHPDHFQVDETFCKVIGVTGYSHSVEMGF